MTISDQQMLVRNVLELAATSDAHPNDPAAWVNVLQAAVPALASFAIHSNHCDTHKHPAEPGPAACTCGLTDLLAAVGR